MAKKGSRSGGNKDFSDYKFISHELTAGDKAALASFADSDEWPLSGIVDLVAEGYKVSFSPDFGNMSVIASITDKQEASPFFKTTLSGRGATTVDAWLSLCYRHLHLAQGDWSYFGNKSESGSSRFG